MIILGPEELGFLAIAISAIAIFNNFTIMGFDAKLISIPGNVDKLLDTAWTLEILRGIFIFAVLCLIAPLISNIYQNNELTLVIQFLSLSLLFLAVKNIGVVYFRKNLDFKYVFIYEMAQWVTYALISILLLYQTGSFWSLVIGQVAGSFVLMITTYLVHPYRPKLNFSRKKIKGIFNFSKWVLINAQMNTFFEHAITLFVGFFWGTKEAGIYERSDFYTRKTGMQAGEILWKIGLPLFSNNQHQEKELKMYFKNMQLIIIFFILPFLCIFSLFLADFFMLFLDSKWENIDQFIFWMSILTMISVSSIPCGILFQSIGKPNIETRLIFIKVIFFILLLYPLISVYDVIGIVFSLIFSSLIYFILAYYESAKILNVNLLYVLQILTKSFVSCLFAAFIVNAFYVNISIFNIIFLIIIFLIIFYLLIFFMLKKDLFHFIRFSKGKNA